MQKKQKTNRIIISLLFLFSFIFTFYGCDKVDDILNPKDDKKKKTSARNEIEIVTEFAAIKQSVIYDILKIFSDNYTKKFYEDDDLAYKEIDYLYEKFGSLREYEKSVTNAASKLLSKAQLNKAGNISSIKGLGNSLKNFFTWATGAGKRSRNRILTISSNMNSGERKKLYNSLRKNWKEKTSSESDFWKKLEKGNFDNQAPQMYNDFYHDAETDFPYLAQEKGLTIQKIVHKEGAEGVAKGSELMIEVTKVVTPLGKGMDMVDKAKEFKDKVQKVYTDPAGAIKDEVKSAIAKKIGGLVDIDGAVDAGQLSENAATAIKFVADYTIGSDDPEEWIKKGIDIGVGKILDSDNKGQKADIVLAENKNPNTKIPSVVISLDHKKINDNLDDIIDIILSAGNWVLSAFDKDGNMDKVEVQIDKNVGTVVVISTDPEGEHQKGNYALSVWASPSDPAPGQSVKVHAKINPVAEGVDIYFHITGTDGYSNEETIKTDNQGLAKFTIPGAQKDVRDAVTIKIVKTSLTRKINYTF